MKTRILLCIAIIAIIVWVGVSTQGFTYINGELSNGASMIFQLLAIAVCIGAIAIPLIPLFKQRAEKAKVVDFIPMPGEDKPFSA
jgi:hypothetical protein